MKLRYRIFRRGWGTFYCEDIETGKQESLQKRDKHQARTVVHAKNEAQRQPRLNLQMARAYLNAADSEFLARTWQSVMDKVGEGKQGPTLERWQSEMVSFGQCFPLHAGAGVKLPARTACVTIET